MGTRTLFLLGEGEPLLHRELFDMISTAKKLGFNVHMSTNGTLLDDEKIQAIIDSQLDEVKISLWSSSVEGYGLQYPGANPNNFEKVINALKLISSTKEKRRSKLPCLFLHQPINRHNFHEMNKFVDLALATGCDGISLAPFLSVQGRFDSYSLSQEEEMALLFSLQQMKKRLGSLPLKHNIDRVLWRYRVGRGMGTRFPCYIAWFHSRVRVDGTVSSCGSCNIVMGNLKEMSFSHIWNGSSYRNFRSLSLSPGGLAALSGQCDCQFCCYTEDNVRADRFARLFSPLIARHKQ